jgi:prepilin-type processing-associated H-X9-DG protein
MADNPTRLCANCGFFDGHCNMYDYPVNAGEVCDSWYPEG